MTDDTPDRDKPGFEFRGRFYPWSITDMGKDLMLIDRFTGMSIADYFDVLDDDAARSRGPILLALIATALRAGNPSWSVQRIVGTVENLSLSDVEFIGETADDAEESPLAVPPTPPPNGTSTTSKPTASSPSLTLQDNSDSATSYATPV